MEQAVGHCGGSEARTEMFRTSHQDSKGKNSYKDWLIVTKFLYRHHYIWEDRVD